MASSSTPRALRSFICQSCRRPLAPSPARRAFTTTPSTRADEPTDLADPSPPSAPRPPTDDALTGLANLSSSFGPQTGYSNRTSPVTSSYLDVFDQNSDDADSLLSAAHSRNYNAHKVEKPHRLHVMATKHNTHITFVQPPKSAAKTVSSSVSGTSASAADQKKMIDVLLSLSTGNIGFRKAGRGSYDAAYQLAAFALRQMQEKGMLRGVHRMEVVLRGFGAGRDAVTKAILGAEGRAIRGKITAVVDATRLKLGGPRSKKPRRLG